MPLVYYSGSLGSTSHRPRFIDMCRARLLSCHGAYLATAKRWLADAHVHPQAKERYIMLDSGAFTSWSRGEHITLAEVMRNYRKIVDNFAPHYKRIYLINLDVIPGSKGVTPTRTQVAQALIESDKNFEIMTKEFGNVVLPVYHQGESFQRLHEVSLQNPDYICVSPRNDLSERDRYPWVQRSLTDTAPEFEQIDIRAPNIPPAHGLAATGVNMMLETGYFSVDSATWVQIAGFGGIMIKTSDGMSILHISSESPSRRYYGHHYDNVTRDVKRIIENQAESIGVTVDELRTKPGGREWFNLNTIDHVSESGDREFTVQQTLWEP